MSGYENYPNPDDTPNETSLVGCLVLGVGVPFWCLVFFLVVRFFFW